MAENPTEVTYEHTNGARIGIRGLASARNAGRQRRFAPSDALQHATQGA